MNLLLTVNTTEAFNKFPLDFWPHVIFCVVGALFFIFQFIRQKKAYQITTAVAIAATLLLYVGDYEIMRPAVGVIELVLIVLIFVLMFLASRKEKALEKSTEADAVLQGSEAVK